jgi:hypothetical protein
MQNPVQAPMGAPVAAPPVDALSVAVPRFIPVAIPVSANVDFQIPVSDPSPSASPSASPSRMPELDYVTVSAPGQYTKCKPQYLFNCKPWCKFQCKSQLQPLQWMFFYGNIPSASPITASPIASPSTSCGCSLFSGCSSGGSPNVPLSGNHSVSHCGCPNSSFRTLCQCITQCRT